MHEIAKAAGNENLFSVPWRNIYAKRKNSGPCMKTCRILCPNSCEEFYINGHSINPKMSFEHIEELAIKYRAHTGREDLPLSLYYDNIVCHNFVETFEGSQKELEVIKALKNADFKQLPSTDEDDWKYGADIIAEKNLIIHFIQVKPISFLFSKKRDCVDDRKKIFNQFIPEQIRRNGGKKIPFIWLFYDYSTKDWVFNPLKNNFQFDIEELLDRDSFMCSVKKEYEHIFDDENNRRKSLTI